MWPFSAVANINVVVGDMNVENFSSPCELDDFFEDIFFRCLGEGQCHVFQDYAFECIALSRPFGLLPC